MLRKKVRMLFGDVALALIRQFNVTLQIRTGESSHYDPDPA